MAVTSRTHAVGVLLAALVAGAMGGPSAAGIVGPDASSAEITVNQVGYPLGSSKAAYVLATRDLEGEPYRVVDGSGNTVGSGVVGANRGRWNSRYRFVGVIDVSPLDDTGTYRIEIDSPDATSPTFRVAPAEDLYRPLLENGRTFFQTQRDGPDVVSGPLDRQPSHLNDSTATVYEPPSYRGYTLRRDLEPVGLPPVDVSGGWFDAGDYLKFVQTTSYADAMLLAAVRTAPDVLGDGGSADLTDEVRFGTDWLLRMWDDDDRRLLYQVGIGDGNGCGSICADHDIWRLPEADDTYGGSAARFRYIRNRPALLGQDEGDPISPNLAGRLAAAFGLCSQVYRDSDATYANRCLAAGQRAFDQADTTWRGNLLTVSPHGYYPESSYRDDLELGATQLALALLDPGAESVPDVDLQDPEQYVAEAARWARAYVRKEAYDTLNLYDSSALAHADLFDAIERVGDPGGLAISKAALRKDLRRQVEAGLDSARDDPFGVGYPYGFDVASHLFGLVATAQAHDRIDGGDRYADFAAARLGAVLGANAWGTSLVIGAGTTFPNCPQHQIANLNGSRDGTPPYLAGAVVNGPNDPALFDDLGLPENARPCPPGGGDPFERFTGHGGRYLDDVRAWMSVEPAIVFTATSILALAGAVAG